MINVTIDFTGATLVTTSAPTINGLVSHNGATTTFTATIMMPCMQHHAAGEQDPLVWMFNKRQRRRRGR